VDVCLMIEGQEGVSWDQWVGLAEACERHGLHGLFRSDHYLSFDDPRERGALDAWTTLSALAAVTERIRLGTMVSPVTFRHPALLAKAVVTADHVSGGRVELGMGAGWFEREHRAFGFPFPPDSERIEILSEQVEIVHRLWDRDEDEVSFEGSHYRLESCPAMPKPVQVPHPPLILGGGAGPRAAALAARWADEYNITSSSPEDAAAARGRLSAACEAIGRDANTLRLSLMTGVVVGRDRRELEARASALMQREGESGDPAAAIERWSAEGFAGTVDQVLERLADYAEAGVQRVMLQHLVHEDLETVELIGAEIVPEATSR
jgi:F420-dependent oxidoreductase-like protein